MVCLGRVQWLGSKFAYGCGLFSLARLHNVSERKGLAAPADDNKAIARHR